MQTILNLAILIPLLCCGQLLNDNREISGIQKLKGFEMVKVKGGPFLMGGLDIVTNGGPRETDLLHGDECPHSITVKDFSIGKYEVTQAEWRKIMGENPSKFNKNDKNPVENVSWEDVQIFIAKLNSKYSDHFRLPTEEEWEFSARGGLQSKNFRYSGSNNANEVAWWESNSNGKPHSVGTLKPNELGIYDMSGNIWEWCSNWKTPYPCNPECKSFAMASRVLRGGTFSNDSSSVRTRDRNGRGTTLRLPTLGFRLAK
jgi:formylglycine-generating enzyme required for sulfatase activity